MNIAVIFAGGVGRRMHTRDLPKQFLQVYGKPIIIHTLQIFDTHKDIDAIVIACVKEWIPYLNELIDKYDLKKEELTYEVIYSSGLKSKKVGCYYDMTQGKVEILDIGVMGYRCNACITNNSGEVDLTLENRFTHPLYTFIGWNLRIKEDGLWYWLLKDSTLKHEEDYCANRDGEKLLLISGSKIPYIPSSHVTAVVLEAVWEKSWITKVKKMREIISNLT